MRYIIAVAFDDDDVVDETSGATQVYQFLRNVAPFMVDNVDVYMRKGNPQIEQIIFGSMGKAD